MTKKDEIDISRSQDCDVYSGFDLLLPVISCRDFCNEQSPFVDSLMLVGYVVLLYLLQVESFRPLLGGRFGDR